MGNFSLITSRILLHFSKGHGGTLEVSQELKIKKTTQTKEPNGISLSSVLALQFLLFQILIQDITII